MGNGLRYGRRYQLLSHLLSLFGFLFALSVTPFWSHNIGVGAGFLLALLIIPFYVGMLAERLKAALKQSQDALREKQTELDELIAQAKIVD
jgi:ABC-type transport system involved in cytochrome bd biosynthesis fused ATPase/permease subunit